MTARRDLPLADAPLLERSTRRTEWTRRILAMTLAAALAACAALVLVRPGTAGARGRGRPTVVVLDVSGSIETAASRRVRKLLESVASHSPAGAGLVLFSDTGYVALPPRSRPQELLAYARYFRTPSGVPSSSPSSPAAATPWEGFTGGTSISAGLAAARHALARARVRAADVVVASDFSDDPMDEPYLRRVLRSYGRTPGISLWTAPLPTWSDTGLAFFRRYAPSGAPRYRPSASNAGARETAGSGAGAPLTAPFLLAACLLLAALAAHGFVDTPLSWGEQR